MANVTEQMIFDEILDRFEESVREEASAIANRQGPKADEAQLRKMRYRKAITEYVLALHQNLEEKRGGS